MTCVVGVIARKDRRVILATDSSSSSDSIIEIVRTPKVHVRDGIAFGFTTSWRWGAIIAHALIIPPRPPRMPVETWVAHDLVNALRSAAGEGGFLREHEGRDDGGCALIAVGRHLFKLNADFGVTEPSRGIASVGSGSHYAMGAMFEAARWDSDARKIATAGLRAATAMHPNVGGPFQFHYSDSRR